MLPDNYPAIVDAEAWTGLPDSSAYALSFFNRGLRPPPTLNLAGLAESDTVAYAEVNHGRWIVKCPRAFCMGAQFAHRSDPRFTCHECGNANEGWKPLPVVWPDAETTAAIEVALLARPAVANRNWRAVPPESIEDLLAENESLGV